MRRAKPYQFSRLRDGTIYCLQHAPQTFEIRKFAIIPQPVFSQLIVDNSCYYNQSFIVVYMIGQNASANYLDAHALAHSFNLRFNNCLLLNVSLLQRLMKGIL